MKAPLRTRRILCMCTGIYTLLSLYWNVNVNSAHVCPTLSGAPGWVYYLVFTESLIRGITITQELLKTAALLSVIKPLPGIYEHLLATGD